MNITSFIIANAVLFGIWSTLCLLYQTALLRKREKRERKAGLLA